MGIGGDMEMDFFWASILRNSELSFEKLTGVEHRLSRSTVTFRVHIER